MLCYENYIKLTWPNLISANPCNKVTNLARGNPSFTIFNPRTKTIETIKPLSMARRRYEAVVIVATMRKLMLSSI